MVSFMKIKLKSLLMRMRRKILSRSWKIVSKRGTGEKDDFFLLPSSCKILRFPSLSSSVQMHMSVRRLVGSTQTLVSLCSHRPTLDSRGGAGDDQ